MFSIHFVFICLLFLNIYFNIILIIIKNIGFKTQMAEGYVQNLTSVNLHIYGYVSLEISEFMFTK